MCIAEIITFFQFSYGYVNIVSILLHMSPVLKSHRLVLEMENVNTDYHWTDIPEYNVAILVCIMVQNEIELYFFFFKIVSFWFGLRYGLCSDSFPLLLLCSRN